MTPAGSTPRRRSSTALRRSSPCRREGTRPRRRRRPWTDGAFGHTATPRGRARFVSASSSPGSASTSSSADSPPAAPTRMGPARSSSTASPCLSGLFLDRRRRPRGAAAGTVERDVEDLLDRVDEDEVELLACLGREVLEVDLVLRRQEDRKSTRLNSSHGSISYAV